MKNGLDSFVSHKGRVMTRKQFVETLVAEGYSELRTRPSGAVKRYSIWNENGNGFDITPTERKLITRLLEAK